MKRSSDARSRAGRAFRQSVVVTAVSFALCAGAAYAQGQGSGGLAGTVNQLSSTVQQLSTTVQSLSSRVQQLENLTSAIAASVKCLGAPLGPTTSTVYAPLTARGSYSADAVLHANTSVVGRFNFQGKEYGPFRDYFVFDVSSLATETDLVVGAQLITYNGPEGFSNDGGDTLTLLLNRVSTAPATLVAGTAGTAGFVDLADGPVYGTYVASSAVNNAQVTIGLSNKAVRDINGAISSQIGQKSKFFAVGGSLTDHLDPATNSQIFLAAQSATIGNTALELTVQQYSATAICPPPIDSAYR